MKVKAEEYVAIYTKSKRSQMLFCVLLFKFIQTGLPMKISQPWTSKHWCESVKRTEWPFAYSKYLNQSEEIKGRVSTNNQDVRHTCETRGVQSKCHICEDITCGIESSASERSIKICNYQLQGVAWNTLSRNIPTVSDVPWSVEGSHRYDFGSNATTHVCMYMTGSGHCQSSFGTDYSTCELRCWGYGEDGMSGRNNTPQSGIPLANVNIGRNDTPWITPTQSATWSYPKSTLGEGSHNPLNKGNLTSLPQGFTFTLAGSSIGEEGFVDGVEGTARFRHPEGVAVDHDGYVYVADAGNHAIRMVSPKGDVTTLAGTGVAGSKDGIAVHGCQFSNPSGIAVWRDWQWWPYKDPKDPDSFLYRNGNGTLTLFVADTGNHRIRKITGDVSYDKSSGEKSWQNVLVECFSGNCDNKPQSGYSDGISSIARFDSPRGVTVSREGVVYISDTNNHLIRAVERNGNARTLAGNLTISEPKENGEPLEGCPPPCLTGNPGFVDGKVNDAQFSFPSDVSMGKNDRSLFVTDRHHLRQIDLYYQTVVTLAGGGEEGEHDGQGIEATFHKPDGVVVSSDGIAYVADAASCRIRRVSPANLVAAPVTCNATISSILRPSGCTSFDPPIDEFGMKVTPVEGNIYYNYVYRNESNTALGLDFIGRGIKDCVGSPPRKKLDKMFWNDIVAEYPYNKNLVIDDSLVNVREDTNEGTVIKVNCPPSCSVFESVYGGEVDEENSSDVQRLYSESSSVCGAAVHAGAIVRNLGGLVDITIHRGMDFYDPKYFSPSNRNGVQSLPIPNNSNQLFGASISRKDWGVQTISGAPASLLMDSCGNINAIPAQEAKFGTPSGVGLFVNFSLNDNTNFLVVADRNNHAIRALSAVCSFTCENGGRCVAPDQCECPIGWDGIDCTRPLCSTPCRDRELCVAPETCSCIPGYRGVGLGCNEPTCVQSCEHGECIAPDTCSCHSGWFDSNCTTPVCKVTCGNGGNCTGPNICSCPHEWKGADCRIPNCAQNCLNGGSCVAPNTCACPPQWSGYQCESPICHQGYFVPNPPKYERDDPARVTHWTQYAPCNFRNWCNDTETFDCAQTEKTYDVLRAPYEKEWRLKTGRRVEPELCTTIELMKDALSMFQYLHAWDNSTTSHHRYSTKTPYKHISKERLPWNAFIDPLEKFTQPWTFSLDRQVALVELHNVTQGKYMCANGGTCIAPDKCTCLRGWIGFDCRTPVCEQGFYEPNQELFVQGTNKGDELESFKRFLGNNTYRLNPASLGDEGKGYSNPAFVEWWEEIIDGTSIERFTLETGGERYLAEGVVGQGGYSCSIRSTTEWEEYRSGFLWEHPNYYSRYMDKKVELDGFQYTDWEGMGWVPTYQKSQKLELSNAFTINNNTEKLETFIYTNQGYRKDGDWTLTGSAWEKGNCIIEFKRICDNNEKAFDLEAAPGGGLGVSENNLYVQDTDRSFRPRISYDNKRTYPFGRWFKEGGECVDHVIRGCFNNGTCIGPNHCQCERGWSGIDCSIPICSQPCMHNGNCTHPDICTCEKGWRGGDCSIPECAQNCNDFGKCVAPDTCQCRQWPNEWTDGRVEGGFPLFRKPNGDPQMTGWTGYDCSTPICTQAERFRLNVDANAYSAKQLADALFPLGGHGKDGTLECDNERCNAYNEMVTINDGKSFQTGCGFDPIETGCCYTYENIVGFLCFKCEQSGLKIDSHTLTCSKDKLMSWNFKSQENVPVTFKKKDGSIMLCGRSHNPQYYSSIRPNGGPEFSNNNGMSNFTSNRFLCNNFEWEQGDFIDTASLENESALGADFGLSPGRHIRVNFNNYQKIRNDPDEWVSGSPIHGEGIFECYNKGSCIAPDVCTCMDGWSAFDCKVPLCRHKQITGDVVGCQNGGSCHKKDECHCIQTLSLLWKEYKTVERGLTGWTGTDCSMPICIQAYYDPSCDIPFAPGGEGCYRCPNGGICVAPDICQCKDGWSGFDCRTPVCEVVTDSVIRKQLDTVDEEKVHIFEKDPCGMEGFYGKELYEGAEYSRGNCTLPNQCTCFCKGSFSDLLCQYGKEDFCKIPFQDPLLRHRNILKPNEMFGSRDCWSGYEGIVDRHDSFLSCHMTIYEPNYLTKNSVGLLVFGSILLVIGSIIVIYIRRRMYRHFIKMKIERRKRRRPGIGTGNDFNAFKYRNVGSKEEELKEL